MKYSVSFDLELRKHDYPGKFIAIEGIDGSGKTTAAQELVRALVARGEKAVYTKEPTDGPIGRMIRQVLRRELSVTPVAMQYLFSADRADHQVEIEGKLKSGKTVVTDRYFWSAVAYGMASRGEGEDYYLTSLSILSLYHRFLSPDMTFFLDVSPDIARKRIQRGKKDFELYETPESLLRVDKSYKKLIEKFRDEFIVIDGNRPKEEVLRDLIEKVAKSV